MPETPLFDLQVAEAAINALRPGQGTRALPIPPAQPQGPLTPVTVNSAEELERAAAGGGVDITLDADIGFARIDTAVDVLIRLNGHVIDRLDLVHFERTTAARRIKVLGPGGIGELAASDRMGGTPSDLTFEGVWFSGALRSQPQETGFGLAAQRAALLYCIGHGYDEGDRGAFGIIAASDPAARPNSDIVIYGSNIAANNRFQNDGDNWAMRATHLHRYWIVDSRLQADSWRQANRFYNLHDSVPGYTTPANVGTPRQTTFVNTYHGHAMASIGAAPTDYNRGVFFKDILLVSAHRGRETGSTLFGPHPVYDEGTWVIQGMRVITDDGNIDADFIAREEASAGDDGHAEVFDLDFGGQNVYIVDPSQVDPYAESSNWPMVVSPNVGFVGSSPYETPPFRR